MIDYERLRGAPGAVRGRGKLRGIGFSGLYRGLRHRPLGGGRLPRRRRRPLGVGAGPLQRHRLVSQSSPAAHSHGQGHETTFSQLVSEHPRRADRERRDRPRRHRQRPHGHGHLRLAFAGGRRLGDHRGPATRSSRRGAQDRRAPDGSLGRGRRVQERQVFTVAGTDKDESTRPRWPSPPTCRTTIRSKTSEPGLDETAFYDPTNFTYPGGRAHLRGRDRPGHRVWSRSSTGSPSDDFGKVINPMIVEGQVHGGIAQGVGQALLENCGLRRRRPAPDRLLHGLLHAAGRRPAEPSRSGPPNRPPARTTPLGVKGCAAKPAPSARRRVDECHHRSRNVGQGNRHAGDPRKSLAGAQDADAGAESGRGE